MRLLLDGVKGVPEGLAGIISLWIAEEQAGPVKIGQEAIDGITEIDQIGLDFVAIFLVDIWVGMNVEKIESQVNDPLLDGSPTGLSEVQKQRVVDVVEPLRPSSLGMLKLGDELPPPSHHRRTMGIIVFVYVVRRLAGGIFRHYLNRIWQVQSNWKLQFLNI
jgi:hypothetical protein